METIRYSDDVREVIDLATKLARKARRAAPGDRDYLRGLLMIHRRFNRLDGLLREMNVSPGKLREQIDTPQNAPPPGPTSDLLKNAETIAKGSQNGKPYAVVEVESLLKAFCLSADPIVSRVFTENQITPDKVDTSVERAKTKQGQRTMLFYTKELLEVVVFVLVFLILIKSFLGELRLIPSESMVPGLQVSDRLVIERATRWFRPYKRGDILVFYPPSTILKNDPWSLFLRATGFSGLIYKKDDQIDVAYIKRLIGLPGDTVKVVRNVGVFVNGKELNEPYVNAIADSCTIERPVPDQNLYPTCGAIKVPPHEYFMMGDNRNESADSRYWGFAEDSRVIGRAVFRIWPLPRLGTLAPAPYQKR